MGFWYSERNFEGHSHCCVISGVMALSQTYDHLCLPLTACWSCQPLLERIQSAECQVRGLHLSPSVLVFLRPSHKYSMFLRYVLAYMPHCVVRAYFVRIAYFRYHRVSEPFPEKIFKKNVWASEMIGSVNLHHFQAPLTWNSPIPHAMVRSWVSCPIEWTNFSFLLYKVELVDWT